MKVSKSSVSTVLAGTPLSSSRQCATGASRSMLSRYHEVDMSKSLPRSSVVAASAASDEEVPSAMASSTASSEPPRRRRRDSVVPVRKPYTVSTATMPARPVMTTSSPRASQLPCSLHTFGIPARGSTSRATPSTLSIGTTIESTESLASPLVRNPVTVPLSSVSVCTTRCVTVRPAIAGSRNMMIAPEPTVCRSTPSSMCTTVPARTDGSIEPLVTTVGDHPTTAGTTAKKVSQRIENVQNSAANRATSSRIDAGCPVAGSRPASISGPGRCVPGSGGDHASVWPPGSATTLMADHGDQAVWTSQMKSAVAFSPCSVLGVAASRVTVKR